MPRTTRSAARSPAAPARAATQSRGGRVSRQAKRHGDTASDTTETMNDSSEPWTVRSIRSKQIDETGDVRYLIDWDNWSGDPTWEPEANCKGCPAAIDAFERKIAKRRPSLSLSRHSHSSDRSPSPARRQQNQSGAGNKSFSKSTPKSKGTNARRNSNSSGGSESPGYSSPALRTSNKSLKQTPDRTYRTTRRGA